MKAKCQNCNEAFEYGYSKTGKYCSSKCCGAHKKQEAYVTYQKLFEEGKLKSRPRIRQYVIERDGYKCSSCDLDTWQDKPIPLWLDHIDGNATNNDPSNFRMICLNCDALSDTFGAKNTGNGRKARGLPQYG